MNKIVPMVLIHIYFSVVAISINAAEAGDVGSEQCRIVQLHAQQLVESAIENGKANRNKAIAIARLTVQAAKMAGEINKQCAQCIKKQFITKIDITDQIPCGEDPNPECGNGYIEPGEQCDDGNTEGDDGCSPSCAIEIDPVCGNGIVESGEECDDGDTDDEDGCDQTCKNRGFNIVNEQFQFLLFGGGAAVAKCPDGYSVITGGIAPYDEDNLNVEFDAYDDLSGLTVIVDVLDYEVHCGIGMSGGWTISVQQGFLACTAICQPE